MRILIAEDDPVARRLLRTILKQWDYEIISAKNGHEAWKVLHAEKVPSLAILDRMMPVLDGIDLCEKIRASEELQGLYVILLTQKNGTENVIQGLDAGADDYVVKPFDPDELVARIRVGERVLALRSELDGRVKELEDALAHVRQLQGLIPICSYCKNIRDDKNAWHKLEGYLSRHTDAEFSHGICPDCVETIAKPEIEQLLQKKANPDAVFQKIIKNHPIK